MTPCRGRALLFDDPVRVEEARQLCKRLCPRLIECRAWALRTDVAGMCGGLTDEEREAWRHDNQIVLVPFETVEQTDRRLRDLAILQHLEGGASATETAAESGICRRGVERVKQAHGWRPEDHRQAWRKTGLPHLGAA